MNDRGGVIFDTGKIGYVKPIRQQIMMPGETIKGSLSGRVEMESLRERDALRIHAHIGVFMTPIRWLEPNWPDYVREGKTTSKTISYETVEAGFYGLGGTGTRSIQSYWRKAAERVYNEWYKWPEAADWSGAINQDGYPAVMLEHSWTRCRDTGIPDDAADQTLSTPADTLDVKQLAEVQARYRSALQREVLSYERYQEILKEMYGADGSREVDQVPIRIHEDQLGVQPREMPATDGASLGQYASMYDFGVRMPFTVSAPEHCILTYMLTVRFQPIADETHPLANANLSWEEHTGDPSLLAAMQPQQVQVRDIFNTSETTPYGYLPAGWQWRAKNHQIGRRIDQRGSFPYYLYPQTAAAARDGTRRIDAFRSQSFGDFRIDLYAHEGSKSAIPNALSSFYLGHGDAGKGDGSPYPKQGKLK